MTTPEDYNQSFSCVEDEIDRITQCLREANREMSEALERESKLAEALRMARIQNSQLGDEIQRLKSQIRSAA